MKLLAIAVAAVAALTLPAVSFAQASTPDNAPLTRAQVRADAIALTHDGWAPITMYQRYPRDIERAERRLQAQKLASAQNSSTSEGPSMGGTSQSGGPALGQ